MLRIKILILLLLPLLLVAEPQNGRFKGRIPIRRPVPQPRPWVEESPIPTEKNPVVQEVTSQSILVNPENSDITPDVSPSVNHPIRPTLSFWPRPIIRPGVILQPTTATPQTMMPRFPFDITSNIPSKPITDDTPIDQLNERTTVENSENSEASTESSATAMYPKLNGADSECPCNSKNIPEANAEDIESQTINYPEIKAGVTASPVAIINYPESTTVVTEAPPAEVIPTTNMSESVKPENDHITNSFNPIPKLPIPTFPAPAFPMPKFSVPININHLNVNWPNIIPNKPWYPLQTAESNNKPDTSVSTVSVKANCPHGVPSQPWHPPSTTKPNISPVTVVTTIDPKVNWPSAVPWNLKPSAVPEWPSTATPSKIANRPPLITERLSNQLYDYKCQEPNGYFSVAGQCNEYIECKRNIAARYSCLGDLQFNPKVQWPEIPCSHPAEVKCQSEDVVPVAQNGRFTGRVPIHRPVPRPTASAQETTMPTEKNMPVKEVTSKPIQVLPENSHIKPDVSPPVNHPIHPISPFRPRPTIRPRPIIGPTTITTPRTMIHRIPFHTSSNIPSKPFTDDTPIEQLNELTTVHNIENAEASTEPPDITNYPKLNGLDSDCPCNYKNIPETNPEDIASPANIYREVIAGVTSTPVATINHYPESTTVIAEVPTAEAIPTTIKSESVKPENDHITGSFFPIPKFPVPVKINNLNVNWPNIIPNKPWYLVPTAESNNKLVYSVITLGANSNWPHIVPSQSWYPPSTTEPNNPPVTLVTTVGSDSNWPSAETNLPWNPEPTVAPTSEAMPNRLSAITKRLSNHLYDYKCQKPNGYYAVSTQYNEYIECKRNIAIQYSCPGGLHFNPKAQWPEIPCSYPTKVKHQSEDVVPGTRNGRLTGRIPIRRPVPRPTPWADEFPMSTEKIKAVKELTLKPIQVYPENSKLTVYPANSHIKSNVSPSISPPFWQRPTIRPRLIIEPTTATFHPNQ